MHIQTLITVLTIPVRIPELALAHLAQIVLVEEVAAVAAFAEAFEPVFADEGIVVAAVVVAGRLGGCWVAVGAASANGAAALGGPVRADGDGGGEGGEAFFAEKGREAEVVGGYGGEAGGDDGVDGVGCCGGLSGGSCGRHDGERWFGVSAVVCAGL